MHRLEDYNYDLPETLIAQEPHFPADKCKLLFSKIEDWELKVENKIFLDLLELMSPNTTIFFNNTKVLKARIPLVNSKIIWKNWEEKIVTDWEIFFLKQMDEHLFEALVRPWKKLQSWAKIKFDDVVFEIMETTENWRTIKSNYSPIGVFEKYWQLPLPPYIEYSKEKEDPYQPIFAQNLWSVASPTASLHFTEKLINWLKEKWVKTEYLTLHVWLGTFKPVDSEDITKYNIHEEMIEISKDIFDKIANIKLENQSIVAIWTTVSRTLESLPYFWFIIKNSNFIKTYSEKTVEYWNNLVEDITIEECKNYICDFNELSINLTTNGYEKFIFSTKIYIYPWFKFKIVDELITNFHLPKSSLLMLVSAFMWYENMKKVYEIAIKNEYKFFSFWDAMYIKTKI